MEKPNIKVELVNLGGGWNHEIPKSYRNWREKPAGPHIPLGVLGIATHLSKKNTEASVTISDEQFIPVDEICRRIERSRPAIVGISCVYITYQDALRVARQAKQAGATVVVGGHYATAMAKEILLNRGPRSKDYCVDVVIKNSGEKPFGDFVDGVPISRINGAVYMLDAKIVENDYVCDARTTWPEYNLKLLDYEAYFEKFNRQYPDSKFKRPFITASHRGCANRVGGASSCIFCALMHGKFVTRDPASVWRFIDELHVDYGVDYIWDVSDSFLSDKHWFEDFYKESKKRSYKMSFKVQVRSDQLSDEDTVAKLRNMGVKQILTGFESNDSSRLKSLGKGLNSEKNERSVSLLSESGISIMAYFVLGAPGETSESLQKTVAFAERISSLSKTNILKPGVLVPIPGSRAYEMIKEKTGQKYLNVDIFDWREAMQDWVRLFCEVGFSELDEKRRHLNNLPSDIHSFSY